MLSTKLPGNKDVFKELRVKFVIFAKIIDFRKIFVNNNFVSGGISGKCKVLIFLKV